MGNQCCAANNQTQDAPSASPHNRPQSKIEQFYDEEDGLECKQKSGTAGGPNVQATGNQEDDQILKSTSNNVSEQEKSAIDGVKENLSAVVTSSSSSTFNFEKQPANLSRAASYALELHSIAVQGQYLSGKITQLQYLIQLLSDGLTLPELLRDLKATLMSLHNDFQRFRSFHLRYTLDEKFYQLSAIDSLLSVLKTVYAKHTAADNRTNYEEFSNDLFTGESSQEFSTINDQISYIRSVYFTLSRGQNFSTLPNYIYLTLNNNSGFALWNQLFPNIIETTQENFSSKYGAECGINAQDVQNIISLLDTSNDQRVDIFQWIDFVYNFPDILDDQGRLLPSSVSFFSEHVSARLSQGKIIPTFQGTSYVYPSGAVYTGQLDNLSNRQGPATLKDGEDYEFTGFFVNDFAEGSGREVRKGVVYEGEFCAGIYHGIGALTFPNGRKYVGGFENHAYHGEGVLVGDDGVVYEGTWRHGSLDYGKITYHDSGSVYIGQLYNSHFKGGKGELRVQRTPSSFIQTDSAVVDSSNLILVIDGLWKDDSTLSGKIYMNEETVMYEGTISDWAITGTGKRVYADGYYEGELFRDQKHGEGSLALNNGQHFSGRWFEDALVEGIHYFNNDKTHRYEGEWNKGVIEGKGKFFYPTGGEYSGDVVNGKRHGNGVYKYQNGNMYSGSWVDNLQQGEGHFKYENGDCYNGYFVKGQFQGFGQYIFAKTLKQYIGYWERDQWNGEGKYVDLDGNNLKCGIWKDDKLETVLKEEDIVVKSEYLHLIVPPRAAS